ncbi:hypothetical protein [Streptomyces pinistramenti]|nr:hypothetical protein [Streptomyces pinistramenti]
MDGCDDLPECILCGAPGGYPYCNAACKEADQDYLPDDYEEE